MPKITVKSSQEEKCSVKSIETVGVDIFVQFKGTTEQLVQKLQQLHLKEIQLTMIANRGSKVWPQGHPETFCSDSWRCRFMSNDKNKPVSKEQIVEIMQKMAEAKIEFIQMNLLRFFDGKPGYTLAQDEQ